MWTLYASTYAVANTTKTLPDEFQLPAAGTITLLSTLAANIPLGVRKDLVLARHYGTAGSAAGALPAVSKPRVRVPKAAAAIFVLRDATTIFGSFLLPSRVAAAIPDDLAGPPAKATVTQMTVPVLSQLVATPLHLLGLDLYDRQGRVPLRDRLAWIWRSVPGATAIRCFRIVPAFGIGAVANMEVRSFFHGTRAAS